MNFNWKSSRLWAAPALAILGIIFINSQNNYLMRIKEALGIADLSIPFHPLMRVEAETGNPEAQYNFGKTYLEHGYSGADAKQVWSDAAFWFRKAADQGYAPAEFKMARCYSFGYCGEKDPELIAKWDRRAAEHGYWWGQDYLSDEYYSGKGVKQSYEEAYFWQLLATDTRMKVGWVVTDQQPYVPKLTPEQEEVVKRNVADWKRKHPVPTKASQPEPGP